MTTEEIINDILVSLKDQRTHCQGILETLSRKHQNGAVKMVVAETEGKIKAFTQSIEIIESVKFHIEIL